MSNHPPNSRDAEPLGSAHGLSHAPLRIAMVGPFGLDPKATMRARAVPAARALARLGHEVLVVMPPWHTNEAPRRWKDGDVTMAYEDVSSLRFPLAGYALVGARLASAAARWRPDVVHIFKPKAYAGIAADALRAGRVLGGGPALIQDTDDWEGYGGWNELGQYPATFRAFFAWQERWGLARADTVTAASLELYHRARAHRRAASASRTYYVPNALDDAAFDSFALAVSRRRDDPPRSPTLMLYTRFFEFDPGTAIQILSEVRVRVPGARLLVAGRGFFDEEATLMARAAAAGLGEAVELLGWVAPEDLPGILARADVALYPFRDSVVNRTKSPVKLLELMASALPVVADGVGEPAAIIQEGVSGHIVTPGDVYAFGQAVAALLTDPVRRLRLGASARARVESAYRWSLLAPHLEEIYRSTIASRCGRHAGGRAATSDAASYGGIEAPP